MGCSEHPTPTLSRLDNLQMGPHVCSLEILMCKLCDSQISMRLMEGGYYPGIR